MLQQQLKNRNYPIHFDENNVIECELIKENAFLQFKFVELTTEDEHLKKPTESSENKIDEILALKDEGKSNVEIGKILGVSESAVRRRVNKHQNRIQ